MTLAGVTCFPCQLGLTFVSLTSLLTWTDFWHIRFSFICGSAASWFHWLKMSIVFNSSFGLGSYVNLKHILLAKCFLLLDLNLKVGKCWTFTNFLHHKEVTDCPFKRQTNTGALAYAIHLVTSELWSFRKPYRAVLIIIIICLLNKWNPWPPEKLNTKSTVFVLLHELYIFPTEQVECNIRQWWKKCNQKPLCIQDAKNSQWENSERQRFQTMD